MTDNEIIELYFAREERAIEATDEKYGAYCHRVANRILCDTHESEECVNDTYLRTWNSIPPTVPRILAAFLAKIVRNLALDRVRAAKAKKRGVSESLDELEAVIGDNRLTEELEAREIGEEIGRFLQGENEKARKIFVRRYFMCEEIGEIAARYRMSEGSISASLFRTRLRLKEHLERAGIII